MKAQHQLAATVRDQADITWPNSNDDQ